MARAPIPTWYFSLVIVRLGHRFLLVQELPKHGEEWYFPAGRVEPGEHPFLGAYRETLEESGVPVVLDGILRIETTVHPDGGNRWRIFFTAHPADDTKPKEVPDSESMRAGWFSLREVESLRLRGGREVVDALRAVENGHPVYPLSLFTTEGAGWGGIR